MGVRSLGNALASFGYKFGRTGLEAMPIPPPKNGLLASGGIVSDYEVSGTYYRAHVFTGSGTFVVSDTGTGEYPSTVEYLVVAGGGGGGARGGGNAGGGGGAGGLRTNLSGHPLVGQHFRLVLQHMLLLLVVVVLVPQGNECRIKWCRFIFWTNNIAWWRTWRWTPFISCTEFFC